MSVGYEERGQWMYTGGEDNTAKVWDFRSALQCQRIFQVNLFGMVIIVAV